MPAAGIGPQCTFETNGYRCPDEAEPGTVPALCEHHFAWAGEPPGRPYVLVREPSEAMPRE